MKAAVVHAFGKPLVIEEVPTPEPGPDEVLVRVEASGLCHTDIHAAHGDWPVKPSLPFIPGHEGVGIVVAVGHNVTRPPRGRSRRRAVARLRLRDVRALRQRLGDALPRPAEHRVLAGRRLRRVRVRSRGVRSPRAGRHRPARRGAADLRRRDDVQGRQGLRRTLVRSRRRLRRRRPRTPGAPVRAASRVRPSWRSTSPTRSSRSRASSARPTRSTRRSRTPPRRSRQLGGADAAISTAATPKPLAQAFASLRRGGTLVLVGLPRENQHGAPDLRDRAAGHHASPAPSWARASTSRRRSSSTRRASRASSASRSSSRTSTRPTTGSSAETRPLAWCSTWSARNLRRSVPRARRFPRPASAPSASTRTDRPTR